jgi:hypothetical protein
MLYAAPFSLAIAVVLPPAAKLVANFAAAKSTKRNCVWLAKALVITALLVSVVPGAYHKLVAT